MRIFVAGASGVIGRPLVRELVDAGHEVTGMTRRTERAGSIESAGAKGVVCDVFDRERLTEALAAAEPEVVVHELTALPHRLDLRKKGVYDATNRVRTEGTRNLIDAALAAGARRLVAQSIAFIYKPQGSWVKSEEDPAWDEAPGEFGGAVHAMLECERQVLEAPRLEGVVLRYGFFYGPGSAYARDGYWAEEAHHRRLPIVGKGEAMSSFIHVGDAAAATRLACERGEAGIYNVVDDEPARLRDWAPAFAAAAGAKRPLRVPVWLARLIAGKTVVELATRLRGASNQKAKRELGWAPRYESWRDGFERALG